MIPVQGTSRKIFNILAHQGVLIFKLVLSSTMVASLLIGAKEAKKILMAKKRNDRGVVGHQELLARPNFCPFGLTTNF